MHPQLPVIRKIQPTGTARRLAPQYPRYDQKGKSASAAAQICVQRSLTVITQIINSSMAPHEFNVVLRTRTVKFERLVPRTKPEGDFLPTLRRIEHWHSASWCMPRNFGSGGPTWGLQLSGGHQQQTKAPGINETSASQTSHHLAYLYGRRFSVSIKGWSLETFKLKDNQ